MHNRYNVSCYITTGSSSYQITNRLKGLQYYTATVVGLSRIQYNVHRIPFNCADISVVPHRTTPVLSTPVLSMVRRKLVVLCRSIERQVFCFAPIQELNLYSSTGGTIHSRPPRYTWYVCHTGILNVVGNATMYTTWYR
jgi:hypothetical protein